MHIRATAGVEIAVDVLGDVVSSGIDANGDIVVLTTPSTGGSTLTWLRVTREGIAYTEKEIEVDEKEKFTPKLFWCTGTLFAATITVESGGNIFSFYPEDKLSQAVRRVAVSKTNWFNGETFSGNQSHCLTRFDGVRSYGGALYILGTTKWADDREDVFGQCCLKIQPAYAHDFEFDQGLLPSNYKFMPDESVIMQTNAPNAPCVLGPVAGAVRMYVPRIHKGWTGGYSMTDA